MVATLTILKPRIDEIDLVCVMTGLSVLMNACVCVERGEQLGSYRSDEFLKSAE